MIKKIFTWLGREFVELSAEAEHGKDATVEARDIFARFERELGALGLSLDHTVRSRLWGRDRASRDAADCLGDGGDVFGGPIEAEDPLDITALRSAQDLNRIRADLPQPIDLNFQNHRFNKYLFSAAIEVSDNGL